MFKKSRDLILGKITSFHEINIRTRTVLILHLIAIPFLIAFMLKAFLDGAVTVASVDIVISLLITISFALMVFRGAFVFGTWLFVIITGLLFLFLLFSGGVDGTGPMWLYTYPVIIMFILRTKMGFIVNMFFIASCSFLFFMPHISDLQYYYSMNYKFRFLGSLVLVFLVTLTYEILILISENKINLRNHIYGELFENVPIGIYQASMVGDILKVNHKMATIFGFDTSESFMEVCSRSEIFKSGILLDQVAEIIREKGHVNGFERRLITIDGREITVRENIRRTERFTLQHGQTVYFEGTIEDVSDLKETEEQQNVIQNDLAVLSASAIRFAASENSEKIFKAMLDHLSVILGDAIILMSTIDSSTRICTIKLNYMHPDMKENHSPCQQIDFSGKRYQLNEKTAQDLLNGEIITLDDNQSAFIYDNIFENKMTENKFFGKSYLMGISWNKRVFGTICILMTNDNYLSSKKMDVIETLGRQLGVIMDRNAYLDDIKRQSAFIETLLDTIPVPVFYKDRNGKYLGCNKHFEEFTGYKRENLIGNSSVRLI